MVNATSRPLYPWERSGTHCIEGWVGPSADLDGCGKSSPHRIRSPDRQARSKSLYRLSYHGQPLHFLLRIHSARTACLMFLDYTTNSNTYRAMNNTTIFSILLYIYLSVNKIYSIRILLTLHSLQIDLLPEKVISAFQHSGYSMCQPL